MQLSALRTERRGSAGQSVARPGAKLLSSILYRDTVYRAMCRSAVLYPGGGS